MNPRLGIGVIGAGKVGCALASAWRAAGHGIVGVTTSSERVEAMLPAVPVLDTAEVVRRAEVVAVTVPDDQLAGVVEGLGALGRWQLGQIVLHTSGTHGVEVLEPAARAGAIPLALHPAMTFTGTSLDVARLVGCPFAVTARAAFLPIAQALVVELGGEPFVIQPADRPTYHAALTHGANHLVTLVSQAVRMLEAIGVERPAAVLGPLLAASLEGALESGESLLTGPVVRGDVGTLRAHLAALGELVDQDRANGDIAQVYAALARATAGRALARGVLSEQVAQAFARELTSGREEGGA